ncbi:MAG: cytochrome C assembly protein [Candidatus Dadabacteria bacterium]|nr:MAG: cytochrome C assembly protein [Candidatus Dadabacteria bacterium]
MPASRSENPLTEKLETIWYWCGKLLTPIGAALLLAGLWLVAGAPIEALQGPPQKIFYLHVSLAWISFVLFGGVALSGIVYLVTRQRFWDQAGHGLASTGFVFLSGVLVTGPIWARPIWGTWWVWEPRLTTTFILWLLFAAYHLIRLARGNDGWTARACAVLGIFAFADVPVIHLSVLWWRSMHPFPVVMRKGDVGGGLDPAMVTPLLVMVAAMTCLGLGLSAIRTRLRKREDTLLGVFE